MTNALRLDYVLGCAKADGWPALTYPSTVFHGAYTFYAASQAAWRDWARIPGIEADFAAVLSVLCEAATPALRLEVKEAWVMRGNECVGKVERYRLANAWWAVPFGVIESHHWTLEAAVARVAKTGSGRKVNYGLPQVEE